MGFVVAIVAVTQVSLRELRYSDSLRAGWSRDRIPVEVRFFAPVQIGPGTHPTSSAMGAASLAGEGGGGGGTQPGHVLNTHPHLAPRLKK